MIESGVSSERCWEEIEIVGREPNQGPVVGTRVSMIGGNVSSNVDGGGPWVWVCSHTWSILVKEAVFGV